jgi:cation:H+ antiporter
MLIALTQLGAGFLILGIGGRYIVRGAVSVALLARISTAVVGLTVVAFGTSLPELAVSVKAAGAGSTDIAYANVVGSSIFNIAVILALTSLVRPVSILTQSREFEFPGMMVVLALCLFMARDALISRPEGSLLVLGLVFFLALTVMRTRRAGAHDHSARDDEVKAIHPEGGSRARAWSFGLGFIGIGIVGLWAGAEFMVTGATTVAEAMGISERIIGLTVVAMGTSLPELVTTLIAAKHGEDEIALSNLMGSNIFNILAVLGWTSFVFPVPVNVRAVALDNWVMLGFGAALLPIMWTSHKVTRWHAAILLAAFTAYFVVLVRGG